MKKLFFLLSLIRITLFILIIIYFLIPFPKQGPFLTATASDPQPAANSPEYDVIITVDNPKVRLTIDGEPMTGSKLKLSEGAHSLGISGDFIKTKTLDIHIDGDVTIPIKTDPVNSRLTHLKTLVVGSLPKGMEFTADGKHLFISLLGEPRIALLDGMRFEIIKYISHPDKPYSQAGFVEIGISPLGDAVIASQMTTASIHVIPLSGEDSLSITKTIPTRGNWSKVVTLSASGRLLAVSNWTSYDISFFTYPELEFIRNVRIPGIPRGMIFANDDSSLYVSNYSNGALHKIDLNDGKIVDTISVKKPGALRHLVLDREKNIMYASDMEMECINIYDLTAMKLVRQVRVDYNPNTIAFSPDMKYLFVACRGPNAKSSYLDRSPRSGKLYMIDCTSWEVLDIRTLGNQPTALAVHPSGEYLAVSNFRDKNIEVYSIDK